MGCNFKNTGSNIPVYFTLKNYLCLPFLLPTPKKEHLLPVRLPDWGKLFAWIWLGMAGRLVWQIIMFLLWN
jgi:hypothetical protein